VVARKRELSKPDEGVTGSAELGINKFHILLTMYHLKFSTTDSAHPDSVRAFAFLTCFGFHLRAIVSDNRGVTSSNSPV
jgi:hypothetical protein